MNTPKSKFPLLEESGGRGCSPEADRLHILLERTGLQSVRHARNAFVLLLAISGGALHGVCV